MSSSIEGALLLLLGLGLTSVAVILLTNRRARNYLASAASDSYHRVWVGRPRPRRLMPWWWMLATVGRRPSAGRRRDSRSTSTAWSDWVWSRPAASVARSWWSVPPHAMFSSWWPRQTPTIGTSWASARRS